MSSADYLARDKMQPRHRDDRAMGLLLNAAPSGAEHIRRLRGVDAGQISGPVLMGARPKPGRRLTDMTEMTAQVGRVATRSGGRVRDRTPIS